MVVAKWWCIDPVLSFCKGVARCLGKVFLVTSARRKLIAASEAGITWLQRRCTYLLHTDLYINNPLEEDEVCLRGAATGAL